MSKLLSQIEFREGAASDWSYIAKITESTWGDDTDYLTEDLWAQWIEADEGIVQVATFNQHVVGFGRVSSLGPAEWWLEGLRVHPDLRGRGLARLIMDTNLAWFRKNGNGILRFSTYNDESPVHHLAQEYGFKHTGSFVKMAAKARNSEYSSFKIMEPQNVNTVQNYLRRSPMNRVNKFYEQFWTLYYLTDERVEAFLSGTEMEVIGWREFDQLHGLALIAQSPPPGRKLEPGVMYLAYLDAPDDTTFAKMLKALRGLAAFRGYETLQWKMPTGMGLESVASDAAFKRQWDDDGQLWLYERPITL